jgi:hypothetical protein
MAQDNYFGSRLMAQGTPAAEQIYNDFMGYLIATGYRILSRTVNDPPASPALLDTYLVPVGAINDWDGLDGNFVFWQNGWLPVPPQAGMRYYIVDQAVWVDMRTATVANSTAIDGEFTLPLVFASGSWKIIWDGSRAATCNVTLNNDAIFETPTNFVAGRHYMLRVTQDGTGGRSLTPANNGFVTTTANDPLTGITALAAGESADIYIIGPQGALGKPAIYLVNLDTTLVNVV